MFSSWDLVRPSLWHPMSMVEQSMMDLDMAANQMLGSRFPMTQSMLAAPSNREDDEFFKDLPVVEQGQQPERTLPESQREGNRAFSSYSFSNSSVVDDKGRRIASTRRRYEDSTGRLKAVHEREVDDKRLKTIWSRKSRDDEGDHKTLCSKGTLEEFEKLWSETPFGQAQEKKTKELKEKGEASTGGSSGSLTSGGEQKQQQQQHGEQCSPGCTCSDCAQQKQCSPGCECTKCKSGGHHQQHHQKHQQQQKTSEMKQ